MLDAELGKPALRRSMSNAIRCVAPEMPMPKYGVSTRLAYTDRKWPDAVRETIPSTAINALPPKSGPRFEQGRFVPSMFLTICSLSCDIRGAAGCGSFPSVAEKPQRIALVCAHC